MANPYGIAEVDLPGIYGAVSNLRSARVQQMLGQQQIRASEAALDRQGRIQQVLAGAYGRALNTGSQSEGANGTGAGSSAAPAAAAPSSPAAAAAPVAPQSYQLPPEIQAQLIAIDPEQGGQIVQAFRQMDTAQRERMAAANGYLANFAQYLTGIPVDQRPAEIQRRSPDLLSHGITQQQISSFTPDDNSLRYVIGSARDIEKLAEEAAPHPMVEPSGGRIIDTNRRDAQGRPVVISESPTITVNGEVYARPPEMSSRPPATAPQVGEVRRGYRYNGGDPANPQSWSPAGTSPTGSADLDNWNNAGRAGPGGPRTFR